MAYDIDKNFISKEFKHYTSIIGITTKSVLIKAHNSIGLIKRYHGLLQQIYQIITAKIADINKYTALQMALKALNNSTGPGGLVFTLLVFGAYPCITDTNAPSATVAQRAAALKKAINKIKKLQAECQVINVLAIRNGPKVNAIHNLPLNSLVLI